MQEPLAHGDRTDEHAMDLPLPSPAAVAAAVPPQGDAAPEGGQPAGEAPQVLGPEETKQHQGELVDWPTQLHSDEQLAPGASGDADEAELVDQATMIESEEAIKARHSGAIAPGPGREGSVVGGAVEVDSDPSKRLKVEATPDGIDVAGIDGVVSTDEFVMPPHGQVSGTQELSEQMKPAPRFTSLQVMILAGGITLLLAAVITLVVLLAGNGDDGSEVPVRPEGPSGSIIVTARPHAACTIALDGKAKGLLSPGTSLSVPGTPVGKHTITVTCVGGFKPYTTAIEVKRAKVTFVEAMLKKE
jgi:hypothetical protein